MVAGELDRLRAYYRSSDAQKRARACAQRFGARGEEISAPHQQNLGCLGWKLDVMLRPSQMEKDIAAVELKAKLLSPAPVVRGSSRGDAKNWTQLAKTPYRSLLSKFQFESLNDARKIYRQAKARSANCSEAEARAALRMELESFLPSREVFSMMENLYASAGACLTSESVAYETLHSRMGFLFIERHEFQKAANALVRAAKTERSIDETRVNFWLGFLDALKHYEGDGKFSLHSNPWWQKLEKAQPLSLHAVAARHLMGRSSEDLMKSSQVPTLAIYQGGKWSERNYWAFLMVLAKALDDKDMMKSLAKTQVSHLRMTDFHDALFYATAQREAGEKKASFRAVQAGIRAFGSHSMSKNVLSLLFPLHYVEEINAVEECRDPALVLSLIRQESSFEETATSYRGAVGLMQVLPAVGRDRLKNPNADLTDAAQNIRAGCLQLDAMMREFDNESILAVASFNSGLVPVRKWQSRFENRSLLLFSDLIPFQETRHFVANVLAGNYWYGSVLGFQSGLKVRNSMGLPVGIVPIPDDFGVGDAMEIDVAAPESPKK